MLTNFFTNDSFYFSSTMNLFDIVQYEHLQISMFNHLHFSANQRQKHGFKADDMLVIREVNDHKDKLKKIKA